MRDLFLIAIMACIAQALPFLNFYNPQVDDTLSHMEASYPMPLVPKSFELHGVLVRNPEDGESF